MNKFIKKYPQFWDPKVGDKVKIKAILDEKGRLTYSYLYKIGEIGIIKDISYDPYLIEIVSKPGSKFHLFKNELEPYYEE
jgi:hypothetical protein